MNKKRILIFLLILNIFALISIYAPNFKGLTANAINQEYPKESAILLRVIDGDTIEARVSNETWKIRLLGINTPEKNMPYSENAANFLKQFENKSIELLRDYEDTDKYHRKLRYIFYNNMMLNLEILKNGFANSYYYSGLQYEKEILNSEEYAKEQEIGIWTKSDDECAKQNCIQLKELNQFEEYFIIQNICDFDCSLEGWFVKDAGRNIFQLFSLKSNYEQIYYSKENKEIWNNEGDRFFIFDKLGKLVLFYEYNQ